MINNMKEVVPVAGPLDLWPQGAPGDSGEIAAEQMVVNKDRVRIISNASPTIAVYKPDAAIDTGAAVLVCPGGGYNVLAFDLEGSEIVGWLNQIGVTGILLKYRVPRRAGRPIWAAPLQDAQRAMGIIRQHAADWKIDPNRLGAIGFSAGGHLAATLATQFGSRSYPKIDAADDLPCRPDFMMLIYPGYLTVDEAGDIVSPELAITADPTPAFMAVTADDAHRAESCMRYYCALKAAHGNAELHVYSTGGHGYGLRPSKHTVVTWPARAKEWMTSLGVIGKS